MDSLKNTNSTPLGSDVQNTSFEISPSIKKLIDDKLKTLLDTQANNQGASILGDPKFKTQLKSIMQEAMQAFLKENKASVSNVQTSALSSTQNEILNTGLSSNASTNVSLDNQIENFIDQEITHMVALSTNQSVIENQTKKINKDDEKNERKIAQEEKYNLENKIDDQIAHKESIDNQTQNESVSSDNIFKKTDTTSLNSLIKNETVNKENTGNDQLSHENKLIETQTSIQKENTQQSNSFNATSEKNIENGTIKQPVQNEKTNTNSAIIDSKENTSIPASTPNAISTTTPQTNTLPTADTKNPVSADSIVKKNELGSNNNALDVSGENIINNSQQEGKEAMPSLNTTQSSPEENTINNPTQDNSITVNPKAQNTLDESIQLKNTPDSNISSTVDASQKKDSMNQEQQVPPRFFSPGNKSTTAMPTRQESTNMNDMNIRPSSNNSVSNNFSNNNTLKTSDDQEADAQALSASLGNQGVTSVNTQGITQTIPTQEIQAPKNAAQTIAELANKIVDTIQVNTNSLKNMQEVRITFPNNVLQNTEVVVNLTGNKLDITFMAGSQQAAAVLSESGVNQLKTAIKSNLKDGKEVNIRVDTSGPKNRQTQTATDRAVQAKEDASQDTGM